MTAFQIIVRHILDGQVASFGPSVVRYANGMSMRMVTLGNGRAFITGTYAADLLFNGRVQQHATFLVGHGRVVRTPTVTHSPTATRMTTATRTETATDTPTASPTETATRTPSATETETPTKTITPEPYAVFLLTNVSGGSIWVGQESQLGHLHTCDFRGGGLCAEDGGADIAVTFEKKTPDYPTHAAAMDAYCRALGMTWPVQLTGGTKGRIFGADYWIDNVDGSCPVIGTPTPTPPPPKYAVFLLTNVSGGSIWVGNEWDLKKMVTCQFAGGGLCHGGGKDARVTYVKKSSDFATMAGAKAVHFFQGEGGFNREKFNLDTCWSIVAGQSAIEHLDRAWLPSFVPSPMSACYYLAK